MSLRVAVAMPLACSLMLAATPDPAAASCSISNKVETCSGSVTGGAIVHDDNGVHTLTVLELANTINAADSSDPAKQNGPVIFLKDPGGVTAAPSGWSSSNRNGQAGVSGAAGSGLSATISLDTGHTITGASGVTLESYGWAGSYAHEAQHTDKHATGGQGGAGGRGGDVSLIARSSGGGNPAEAIAAGSGDAASTGLALSSTGGAGGAGGWAHSSGGLKDAQGGAGGAGGAAGTLTVQLLDGHSLAYSGAGIGISLTAQGGNGGDGGYGQVDGIDADSSYGGAGGTGGNGGTIGVTATSAVSTIVTTAVAGVLIQSSGGDGGSGGAGKGGHDHAGDGGDAGNGGAITADLSVDVTTTGTGSGYGIYIKSAGGFAGDSGSDSGGIKNHPGNPGDPGEAGSIALTLTNSRVATDNASADGILIQSIGGMGGSGGAASGLFSYGSKGGSGGAGSTATVTIDATTVATSGDDADALRVQSIGGGGGKAGKTSGISALAAAAGAGGAGGAVNVSLAGSTFQTSGEHSAALMLQSIGGGGGSSGAAGGIYSVGGSGGLGGDGGTVTLAVNGTTIATQGDHSIGVSLQSIGGGGGDSHSPSGAIALGQDGGGGGAGATVTYTSQNGGIAVATAGDLSDAILIQSIGGGGGHGGSTFEALGNFSSNVGSSGGEGGAGGDISYTGSDNDVISTTGDVARGIVLQSIGGGGGSGGNIVTIGLGLSFGTHTGSSASKAENNAGTITADIGGTITTTGDGSTGVVAQSIGGGGGSAGSSASISVGITLDHAQGASGQAGGDGGEVSLTSRAGISTSGANADGILAQSVGGGGGQSSTVVEATIGTKMGGLTSQQGASGGAGGDSGDVTVTSSGTIATTGENSIGIAAQSIAGGGGKAGHTISASAGVDMGSVTVGQSGGAGGKAGTVSVTNEGDITTAGELANAILAQSVGGGGGQAGLTVDGDVSGLELSSTQGGSGGAGGTGGAVSVDNAGDLSTIGDAAVAILAQSLGGGGGAGGTTVHGSASVVSLTSNVGGDGGDGGAASTVSVNNSGDVTTSGNKATAITAQSIGGSGGNAGALMNGTGTGGVISGALTVSVGGSGGKGGKAADVTVINKDGAVVTTTGYNANGISAQSIGGDGGSGGDVYSGDMAATEEGSLTINVSVGGDGGDAGTGGKVTVENDGGIGTSGHYSEAIFAQSVGGNGGDAGSSYALTANISGGTTLESTVTVGGAGGSGAIGSDVTVTNNGALATTGGNAAAIYAQSVGGNGGTGGYGLMAFGNFQVTDKNYVAVKADVEVGGSGGAGSHAGAVQVTNNGSIATQGDTSPGIYAQSVGGGGGDGGNAGSYSLGYLLSLADGEEEPENKGFALSVTIGGGGGSGGDGGAVTVSSSKLITTSGTASYGIFAQSVGGGGGSGGNGSPGLEGWVADIYEDSEKLMQWKEVYEQIKKLTKKDWKALFLESFSVDIGGSAGGTGKGGDVSVTNSGTIITTGDSATAIYAQSVGGGGGTGGDGSQGMLTSVTVTGSGGAGGDGGAVTVDNQGTIQTSGDGAMGIYAQSVGGGGGSAGDVEGTIATDIDSLDEILGYNVFGSTGGKAGDGGNGGDITITSAGAIVTTGANAHGIWAQSVGGGGGSASSYSAGSDDDGVGSDGLEGDGGSISIDVAGSISVSGDGAHGIFAQSASGGSGASYAGGVDITVSGSVIAAGANARAILAQAASYAEDTSTSDPAAGTVHISIAKGATVATTSENAYETVAIKGGRSVEGSTGYAVSNQLYNAGTLTSASHDAVVLATDDAAGLLVHNSGVMSGSVSIGGSHATAFYNDAGGIFALGENVALGLNSGTFLINSGTLSAGGLGVIETSTVTTANFTQLGSGMIQVDLAKTGAALATDLITVNAGGRNNVIVLSGTITPNWVGGTSFASGDTGSFTYLKSANGETIESTALRVSNTATVAYSLSSTANDSVLQANYTVDYTGAASGVSLGRTGLQFARYFSSAMSAVNGAAGAASTATTISLLATDFLNARSGAALARAYDEHTLDESVISAARGVLTSHALHALLQSCPELDPKAGTAFYRERECAWAQVQGGKYHQDASSSMPGFDESVAGISGAVQKKIGEDTFIELGGRFEQINVDGDNFSQEGYRLSAGVAVKREIGIFTVSSTLGGGYYDFDQDRTYSLAGAGYLASTDFGGAFLTGEARAYAVLPWQTFYAKPSIALSATQLWQDGYSETGWGPLNWQVDGISQTAVALHTSLEVGSAFDAFGHAAVVYGRVGLTSMLTDPGIDMVSRLVGDGALLGDLAVTSDTDRFRFDLAGGINMDMGGNLSLSVQGQTGLSENAVEYGGFARLKVLF